MKDCEKLYQQYLSVEKEARAFSEAWYSEESRKKGNELSFSSYDILTSCVKCYLSSLEVLPEALQKFYSEELKRITEDSVDKKVIPFLIALAWESNNMDLIKDEIYQLAYFLLSSRPISSWHEGYLEQILDLLNYRTEELIPVSILKGVCLADLEETNRYGAFIKAVSYLRNHGEYTVEQVLNELRQTDRYRQAEYYREWVDYRKNND